MSISIHAPRTGSDATYKCPDCGATVISIHAPRTGSDVHRNAGGNRRKHFNPRSPHGERPVRWAMTAEICHFNPRSPHGERHKQVEYATDLRAFQSTLPARGATRGHHRRVGHRVRFQSTLPARGATIEPTD